MDTTLTLADHLIHAAIDIVAVGAVVWPLKREVAWLKARVVELARVNNMPFPTPPPSGPTLPTLGGLE